MNNNNMNNNNSNNNEFNITPRNAKNLKNAQQRYINLLGTAGKEMNNEVLPLNVSITPMNRKLMNEIEFKTAQLARIKNKSSQEYRNLNNHIKQLNRDVAGTIINIGHLPPTKSGGKYYTKRRHTKRRHTKRRHTKRRHTQRK